MREELQKGKTFTLLNKITFLIYISRVVWTVKEIPRNVSNVKERIDMHVLVGTSAARNRI